MQSVSVIRFLDLFFLHSAKIYATGWKHGKANKLGTEQLCPGITLNPNSSLSVNTFAYCQSKAMLPPLGPKLGIFLENWWCNICTTSFRARSSAIPTNYNSALSEWGEEFGPKKHTIFWQLFFSNVLKVRIFMSMHIGQKTRGIDSPPSNEDNLIL